MTAEPTMPDNVAHDADLYLPIAAADYDAFMAELERRGMDPQDAVGEMVGLWTALASVRASRHDPLPDAIRIDCFDIPLWRIADHLGPQVGPAAAAWLAYLDHVVAKHLPGGRLTSEEPSPSDSTIGARRLTLERTRGDATSVTTVTVAFPWHQLNHAGELATELLRRHLAAGGI